MKNLKVKTYYYLLIVFLFSSCRAVFYTPNRNPVPLFEESGDLYVDVSTNLVTKADFTAGLAITESIGAYGSYSTAKQSNTSTNTTANTEYKYQYNGNMINLGLGYFVNKEKSDRTRFEIFGDFASGNYKNNYTDSGRNLHLNGQYTRIGIMPNIGYTNHESNFSFAYSVKLSRITFSNMKTNDANFWKNDIERLNSKTSYSTVEHALNFRYGFDKVKFQFQFGVYQGINSDENLNAIPKLNFSSQFGVVFHTNVFGKN